MFANPEQCVEDEFTEIVVGPILVEMAAGETDSASVVRAIRAPHQVFHASLGILNVRVRAFRINVWAIASFI